MFDAIHCINLPRREDRWLDFQQRFPRNWPFAQVTRFSATDGQLCAPPSWWTESAGAWGCLRSHFRIIEESLNAGLNSVLIFEDDALLPDTFVTDAQMFLEHLPADWQMAYFGGQLLRDGFRPPHQVNEWVYRPYNVNRTHAYAVRGTEMLRVLYDHLLSRDWFEKHHIDHHYGRLHQSGKYGVYVPRRWLVGQLGGPSDVSNEATETTYWNHAEEVWARGREPFVAVLGLHESVASRVAAALTHLGVHMGDDLGGSANLLDAEDQPLARLCERAAPFPACEISLPAPILRDKLEDWLGNHMWRARVAKKLAGAKYPHLCVLGNHLRDLCGKRLRVIDVREPFGDAVTALQSRMQKQSTANENSAVQAVQIQSWLLIQKENFLASTPHLSLGRSHIEDNSEKAIDTIIAYLNLAPTAEQIQQAIATLEGGNSLNATASETVNA